MDTAERTPFETEHPTSGVYQPDWSALKLLNQYRLLILMALAAVFYLAEDQRTLGSVSGLLFTLAHATYLAATVCFIILQQKQRPGADIQFYVQNYLDILFIASLMYSSGGINSGIGALLIVNIALLSQLSSIRISLLFAAIASMVTLLQELLLEQLRPYELTNFEATAVHGTVLFLVAWLMTVPLRHLMNRQMVTSTRSRIQLDVSEVAQMNEEIIRELHAGLLVTNPHGNVILINDTARSLLTAEFIRLPIHLKRLCKELHGNLLESMGSGSGESRPIEISNSGVSVLPHYIRLSNGGMLIRLDDHAHIRHQLQQLKLASLGKLSASIAHEIRNPLSAIQHAVQLIEESDEVCNSDRNLILIAKRQANRINRIVENVLQLCNNQKVHADLVSIDKLVQDFAARFKAENHLTEAELQIRLKSCQGVVDTGHLDQILWNICTNSRTHNQDTPLTINITCNAIAEDTAVLDITDNGKGIPEELREYIFDPFYSTQHSGTGLGLYIVRQLCILNGIRIENILQPSGAHFRLTFSKHKQMPA